MMVRQREPREPSEKDDAPPRRNRHTGRCDVEKERRKERVEREDLGLGGKTPCERRDRVDARRDDRRRGRRAPSTARAIQRSNRARAEERLFEYFRGRLSQAGVADWFKTWMGSSGR